MRQRDLIQPFRLALGELVTPGQRLVLGVSGGADSIALLDLTRRARLDLELVVAYLDHGWRSDSRDDGVVVERAAAARGLPAIIGHADVPRSEAAGRAARLAFFARHGDVVALGHTADDQGETVLTHLLRGSGLEGLAAMRPREMVDGLTIVRPMLGLRRSEVRAYCARRGLAFVEDASNQDPRFLRNRVRHELLPLMDRLAPGVAERLARLADVTANDLEVLDEAVAAVWTGTVDADLTVDRRAFRGLLAGVQRALLRRVAGELLGRVPDLSLERVEAARRALLRGRGGAVVEWPDGVRLELAGRRGVFRRCAT